MIKINLVREGRAVRGGGAPAAAAAGGGGGGGSSLNGLLVIALAVIGLLAAGVYWFITNGKLAERESMVTQRKEEAQRLEAVIKRVEEYQKRKDDLQKRIDLINTLKQNQKGPVHIMDQISRDLPDLVWLDTMDVTGGKVSITGRGLNPNAIALLVQNVKQDPYFEEPSVGAVTQIASTPITYGFDMNFGFSYTPKVPGAAGAAGATGTTGTTGTSGTPATSSTAPAAGKPGK